MRKRSIIMDNNQTNHFFTDIEINYMMKNNYYSKRLQLDAPDFIINNPEYVNNVNKQYFLNMPAGEIGYIIAMRPELIQYFDLNKLNQYQMIQVLKHQPELYIKLNTNILSDQDKRYLMVKRPSMFLNVFDVNTLTGMDIFQILRHYPDYINLFDKNKLDGNNISGILADQPELIKNFSIEDLDKLNEKQIGFLLFHQKNLKGYFNKNI